jgi:hypothetical protein
MGDARDEPRDDAQLAHPVPVAVDGPALERLAAGYHRRATRSLGAGEQSGQLVKAYAVEAAGRTVSPALQESALHLARDQLRLDLSTGSTGLAVVIAHAGEDGDHVLVHSWIEAYLSRLTVFTGPPGEPGRLRPAPAGLGPCVWEAPVLAHELTAYVRHVLAGHGPLEDRLHAWSADVLPEVAV